MSSRLCRINQGGFVGLTPDGSTGWKASLLRRCRFVFLFFSNSELSWREPACMSTSQTPNTRPTCPDTQTDTRQPASHDIYCMKFPLLWIFIFKTCERTKMKSPSHHHWGYYEERMLPSCSFFSVLKQSPLKCVENADVTVSNRQ